MGFKRHTLLICLLASAAGHIGISREMNHEFMWGSTESGLQAGIALDNTKRIYRQGESIGFVLSIHNVSDYSIPLEYTKRPLKAWAPEVYDQTGNALPVLPPIPLHGGQIMSPTLEPGETIVIDRGKLEIKPIGWEGIIDETVVVFGETGKYRVAHNMQFGPHHHRPSGKHPWSGELTTGELSIQVNVDKTDSRGFSKADIQTILSLLGDQARNRLVATPLNGKTDRWMQRHAKWESRCAVLTKGEVNYLAHVAVEYPDDRYRAVACAALGNTKEMQAIPPLVKCLADQSPAVRRATSGSLGQLRAVGSISEMLKLLHDNDADVRAGTAFALGHIGSNHATKGLMQALKTEEDLRVKRAMVLGLGWIADPTASLVLKRELPRSTGLLKDALRGAIRNIEDPDYWGLGVKGGISEHELYRLLLDNLDLTTAPTSTEKAKSEIFNSPGEWTSAFQSPNGIVYFLPAKDVYYVRQNKQDPDGGQYYGPFEGNPHEIVRPARKALETRMNH